MPLLFQIADFLLGGPDYENPGRLATQGVTSYEAPRSSSEARPCAPWPCHAGVRTRPWPPRLAAWPQRPRRRRSRAPPPGRSEPRRPDRPWSGACAATAAFRRACWCGRSKPRKRLLVLIRELLEGIGLRHARGHQSFGPLVHLLSLGHGSLLDRGGWLCGERKLG